MDLTNNHGEYRLYSVNGAYSYKLILIFIFCVMASEKTADPFVAKQDFEIHGVTKKNQQFKAILSQLYIKVPMYK